MIQAWESSFHLKVQGFVTISRSPWDWRGERTNGMCMCYFEELGPRLQISVSPLHTPLASISIGNEIKHFHRIYIYIYIYIHTHTHMHICSFLYFHLIGQGGTLDGYHQVPSWRSIPWLYAECSKNKIHWGKWKISKQDQLREFTGPPLSPRNLSSG